jgi:prepilin-type N-terminal cleavage/methylation domain-containing protein
MAVKKTGYSLVEVIIVVLILGALTFIAVPRLDFGAVRSQQAWTVAKTLVTDLRRTRTLAIVNAATNTTGFSLRRSGASYQIVDDSNSTTVDSLTIDSHITCGGDTQFLFGPLGSLRTGSGTGLTVSSQGKTYTISVVSATGIVKCTD